MGFLGAIALLEGNHIAIVKLLIDEIRPVELDDFMARRAIVGKQTLNTAQIGNIFQFRPQFFLKFPLECRHTGFAKVYSTPQGAVKLPTRFRITAEGQKQIITAMDESQCNHPNFTFFTFLSHES